MTLTERINEAREMRTMYIEAEKAILRGAQSYNIAGQSLTRADLEKIIRARKGWEEELNGLLGGGRTIRRVIPVDD